MRGPAFLASHHASPAYATTSRRFMADMSNQSGRYCHSSTQRACRRHTHEKVRSSLEDVSRNARPTRIDWRASIPPFCWRGGSGMTSGVFTALLCSSAADSSRSRRNLKAQTSNTQHPKYSSSYPYRAITSLQAYFARTPTLRSLHLKRPRTFAPPEAARDASRGT